MDRCTGTLVWSTQVDTKPAAVITGSLVVYRGVTYVGISSKEEVGGPATFRGAVIALDAATGTLLWKTYTVPSNNGNSDSNKPGYYSGNAVWSSSPVIDPARGCCTWAREQLQRARRDLHRAGADRMHPARR